MGRLSDTSLNLKEYDAQPIQISIPAANPSRVPLTSSLRLTPISRSAAATAPTPRNSPPAFSYPMRSRTKITNECARGNASNTAKNAITPINGGP